MGTPVGAELDVVLPETRTMVAVLYVGLFAMSFDFVSGYTGYLSFGHAMFYGIGAYFVVLAATDKVPLLGAGTPFVVLLLAGAALAVVVALLVGAVSFRLTGVYFAMITLGFAEVAHVFVRNWGYVSSNPRDGASIGGSEALSIGIPGVATLDVGQLVGDSYESLLGLGIDLSTADVSYYAVGVVVLLSYFAMQRIVHSPFGRVMVAVRENEERARAVGYDTFRYKMGAFAVSAFFAAVAGALFAAYRRSVHPGNSFDLFVTADALLASIIGGLGTLAGPLYGHIFHEFVEGVLSTEEHGLARYLRETLPNTVLGAGYGDVTVVRIVNVLIDGRAELYLGVVFILFVLYVPHGILGTLRERLGGPVAERLPDRARRYLRGGGD
ncbi:branched-chain amino acid ABC transporter permease [Salinilacihabitans rarus]|uniref:branched-chain amino acid ABC transporter permease n=1 Tax=Salinilacihabitans rarus TaxID=2961596 RepID=UPI0020C8FFCC|nr:branched-chain amino acid ABC transporter permease [Salinilacihabitans rarus]